MSNTTTRRPKQSKVDPNESREEKFIRLAKTRSKKLLHQIELLDNLGSSYAYKVNPELAEELISEFEKAIEGLKSRWAEKISSVRSRTVSAVKKTSADADAETDEDFDEEESELEAAEA